MNQKYTLRIEPMTLDHARQIIKDGIDQNARLTTALQMLWPFLEDEKGLCITKSYAMAIQEAALALGKKPFVMQDRHGMFYIEPTKDEP